MAYGFKVWNDHGSVQVDDTYKNMALVTKGIIDRGSAYSGSSDYRIWTITFSASKSALFAFRCEELYIGNYSASYAAASGTWTIVLINPASEPIGSAAFTITYYVFDFPPGSALPAYGLIVRNAAGEITFRSDFKYLRVVGFAFIYTNNSAGDSNFESGRKYAVIIGGMRIFSVTGPGTLYPIYLPFYNTPPGVVSCSILDSGQSYPGLIPYQQQQSIFIDVTDY